MVRRQGIIREREMWQSHCMEARTFNIYQEVDMPGRTTLLMPKPADLAVPPACALAHHAALSAPSCN